VRFGLLHAWWRYRRLPTSGTTPIASIRVEEGKPPDLNAAPHPEVLAAHRAFLEADRRSRRRPGRRVK
jgi:hypothetical protein